MQRAVNPTKKIGERRGTAAAYHFLSARNAGYARLL
jgi:hypothetical protein